MNRDMSRDEHALAQRISDRQFHPVIGDNHARFALPSYPQLPTILLLRDFFNKRGKITKNSVLESHIEEAINMIWTNSSFDEPWNVNYIHLLMGKIKFFKMVAYRFSVGISYRCLMVTSLLYFFRGNKYSQCYKIQCLPITLHRWFS